MTAGLVLEGGGMRGLYTAGVLDVFMEHGIEFDHAVGVSAGAAFGVNIKSRQIGRAIRYNKRFCADPRYAGLKTLVRTGDLYSIDFAYRTVPLELDPFDTDELQRNPMRFTAVCTDIETGEPIYHDIERGDEEDLDWIRADAGAPRRAWGPKVARRGHRRLDPGRMDDGAWVRSQRHRPHATGWLRQRTERAHAAAALDAAQVPQAR